MYQNLAAGISALFACLPRNQRFNSNDVVLSIDSLARSYPLCQIMAALYSNASIALNSVAGESVDFALATAGASPTVIVASSRTMSNYHEKIMRPHTGIISSIARWFQVRDLDAGVMPSNSIFSQIANIGPTAELSFDKLRLLCISHRFDAGNDVRLSSEQLTNLRIFTGARVVYALTGPGVAGAIAQTNVYDYRRFSGLSHFGSPLSSLEAILTDVREGGAEKAVEGQVSVQFVASHSGIPLTVCRSRQMALRLWRAERHCRPGDVSATTMHWSCARSPMAMTKCMLGAGICSILLMTPWITMWPQIVNTYARTSDIYSKYKLAKDPNSTIQVVVAMENAT